MDKLLRLHTYVVDQFFERRRFLKAVFRGHVIRTSNTMLPTVSERISAAAFLFFDLAALLFGCVEDLGFDLAGTLE